MSIFEVIGFAWVVFTSTAATGIFFYFAWKGFVGMVRYVEVDEKSSVTGSKITINTKLPYEMYSGNEIYTGTDVPDRSDGLRRSDDGIRGTMIGNLG